MFYHFIKLFRYVSPLHHRMEELNHIHHLYVLFSIVLTAVLQLH